MNSQKCNNTRDLPSYLKKSLENGLKHSIKCEKNEEDNHIEKQMKNNLKNKLSNNKEFYTLQSDNHNINTIELLTSQSINKNLSSRNTKILKDKYSIKSTFKTSSDVTTKHKIHSFFDQDTTILSKLYKKIIILCGCLDLFFKTDDDEKDFALYLQKDLITSLRISCLWTIIITILKGIINLTFFSDIFHFFNEQKQVQILAIARFAFMPLNICLLYISTYIPMFLPHLEIIISCVFTFMNLSYMITLCVCSQVTGTFATESFCEFSYILEFSHSLQLFILYIALVLFIPIRAVYLWPICATASITFNLKIALNDLQGKAFYNVFSQSYYFTIFCITALIGKRILERKTRFQYINIRHIKQKDELYKQATSNVNCSNAYDEVNFFLHSTIIKINNVAKFLMFKSNDLYEILLNARTDIENCILKLSKLDNLLTVDKDALLSNLKENNMIIEHLFNTIYTKKHNQENITDTENKKMTPLCINEIIKKYREGDRIHTNSYKTIEEFEENILKGKNNYEQKNSINSLFKINLCENTEKYDRKLNKKNYETYVRVIRNTNMAMDKEFDGLGENWDFNMFALQNVLKENTFVGLGLYFLNSYLEIIQCPNYLAYNFLSDIKETYLTENKYHNSLHGADVCQTMLCILNNLDVFKHLNFYTQISTIIATLCHDVGHPGLTNSFLVNTNHNLSVHYNDLSILENYHSALTFFYLKKPYNNFLVQFSKSEFALVRQIIIDLILATDLANHFEFLSIIKIRSKVKDFSILENNRDNINFLKLCIKAADISHTCKPFNIHLLFVINLMLESYQQGEKEKMFSIPVLPFYDFQQIDKLPESQVGFISFICHDVFIELLYIENILKNKMLAAEKKLGKIEGREKTDDEKVDNSFEKRYILDNTQHMNIDELIIHESEEKLDFEKNEDIYSKQHSKENLKNEMFIHKFCLHHLKYNSSKWEKDKNLINIIKKYVAGEIKDEDILKMS